MKDAIELEHLKLGRLYLKIVDFEAALSQLREGLTKAATEGNWIAWSRYVPLMLRIYAERMDFSEIERVKAEIASLRDNLPPGSSTNYTLGIAASYQGNVSAAEGYFREARALAGDVRACARALEAGRRLASIAADVSEIPQPFPSLSLYDSTVVRETLEGHPLAQCRLDTYRAGTFCPVPSSEDLSFVSESAGACHDGLGAPFARPPCWFASPHFRLGEGI